MTTAMMKWILMIQLIIMINMIQSVADDDENFEECNNAFDEDGIGNDDDNLKIVMMMLMRKKMKTMMMMMTIGTW